MNKSVKMVNLLFVMMICMPLVCANKNENVLINAVRKDDIEQVEKLLNEGVVSADSVDRYGEPVLTWAARFNRVTIAKLLLQEEETRRLFELKPLVDLTDKQGGTALMCAVLNGYKTFVQLLLDANADINLADTHGMTPLMQASNKGHAGIVWELICANAVLDSVSKWGKTALSMAAGKGYAEIVRSLCGAQARTDIADYWKKTALMYAAAGGHEEVVSVLVDAGAAVAVEDHKQYTASMLANCAGHATIAKVLGAKELHQGLTKKEIKRLISEQDGNDQITWESCENRPLDQLVVLSKGRQVVTLKTVRDILQYAEQKAEQDGQELTVRDPFTNLPLSQSFIAAVKRVAVR